MEQHGEDRQFRKDGNGHPLTAIRRPCFYAAVEVRAAIIGFTAAGPTSASMAKSATHAARRSRGYTPRAKCWDASTASAGGGTSIGSSVVFGRRASSKAAQHAYAAVPA